MTHRNRFFITAAGLLLAAATASAAPTVEYLGGHTDLAVRPDGAGGVELFYLFGANVVLDNEQPGDDTTSPDVTYIRVPSAQETQRPSSATWDFLGAPVGGTIFFLPQSNNPAVPWLGVSAEPLASNQWQSLTYTIESVDGPGGAEVSIWQTDITGTPFVVVASIDGLPDTLALPIGSHSHYNWGFTEPGVYRVTLRADATAIGGAVASDTRDIFFAVGDDTVIETPCDGDVTGDRLVDGADLLAVINNFGATNAAPDAGDATADGLVDGADLLSVINNFGATCP